jgi:hypothetical protein
MHSTMDSGKEYGECATIIRKYMNFMRADLLTVLEPKEQEKKRKRKAEGNPELIAYSKVLCWAQPNFDVNMLMKKVRILIHQGQADINTPSQHQHHV